MLAAFGESRPQSRPSPMPSFVFELVVGFGGFFVVLLFFNDVFAGTGDGANQLIDLGLLDAVFLESLNQRLGGGVEFSARNTHAFMGFLHALSQVGSLSSGSRSDKRHHILLVRRDLFV